jgi:hypothetical protein
MNMKIALSYNDHRLDHLAPLFTKLHEWYPDGSVWFDNPDTAVVDVQSHTITAADSEFFSTLQEQHLISSWFSATHLEEGESRA